MKKKWIAALVALFAIVLAGCKIVSESEPIAVESVKLSETTLTLAPGATKKLTATVTPDNADDKTVKWSSSDTSVAMVDSDGTVGAIKAGTANITAQAGGKTAACLVTVKEVVVNPESVAVERVTLDAETLALALGEKATLTATVTPSNADDKSVTWLSSNTAVATVNNDGTVTAVAEGTASITAQSGDKTATCAVTVKLVLVAVDGITFNAKTLTLVPGETGTLTATVTPNNVDDKTVKWSSSDTAVATVDNGGTVTAIKEGTTTITARAGSKAAVCTVTVKSQEITTHVHNYSGGSCTVCGFLKPFMVDGTIDESGVLTNYRGAEAIVTIPDGVIGIGSGAFENCGSLKKVVIPGSVTAVGSQAFKNCSNLNTVEMSTGLTGIGSYAFSECTSLKNVSIPDSVTSIGDSAFAGCTGLTKVTIPTSVTSIEGGAFSGCTNLTSVTIPEGVTSIERFAFLGCTNLANVIIPASMTKMAINAFYECENLATVQYNGTLAQWCALNGNGGLTSYAKHVIMSDGTDLSSDRLVIPIGVKSIGSGVFYECTSFTSVTISASVTSIGSIAFSGCAGLTSVNIPGSVTSIGMMAFSRCTGLTSVNIPISVMSIGNYAFFGCTNLETVTYDGTKEQWNKIEKDDDIFSKVTTITGKDENGNETTWSAR